MRKVITRAELAQDYPALGRNCARFGITYSPSESPEPNGQCIVFVHGFGGHPIKSWRGFPKILEQETNGAAAWHIAFFGHESSPFELADVLRKAFPRLPFLRSYDIDAKGRDLFGSLTDLVNSGDIAKIHLCAHSLGGLVVLAALRAMLADGSEPARSLFDKIDSLTFFGTPFGGSDRMQNWAQQGPDAKTLDPDDKARNELVAWGASRLLGRFFQLNQRYARVSVLYSARDVGVSPESALGLLPSDAVESVNLSHGALAKPESAGARPYTFLQNQVLKYEAGSVEAQFEERIKKLQRCKLRTAILTPTSNSSQIDETRAIYEDDRSFAPNERVEWSTIMDAIKRRAASTAAAEGRIASQMMVAIDATRVAALSYIHYPAPSLNPARAFAWFPYLANVPPEEGRRAREPDQGLWLAWRAIKAVVQTNPACRGFFFELDLESDDVAQREQRKRRARMRLYARNAPIYVISGLAYQQPSLDPSFKDAPVSMHLMFMPYPATFELKSIAKRDVAAILDWIVTLQVDAYGATMNDGYVQYVRGWRERSLAPLPDSVSVVLASEWLKPASKRRK